MTVQSKKENQNKVIVTGLLALGVVFGDIGTSPLYAFRLCFSNVTGILPNVDHVMGITSLIFWSMTIVISVKYLLYILRANLNGEGGVLALMALGIEGKNPRETGGVIVFMGLIGAALLYGDGMITPAMSVLSAVEGISVATPEFKHAIIPISIIIIAFIFILQKKGSEKIGLFFGPIMFVWFMVLACLGLIWIIKYPAILMALNPMYALIFLFENGMTGYLVLGFIFLVVTGGEALYADLGHFGLKPIRVGWFYVAMPALLINYFGQASLVILHPENVSHSFYAMAPNWAIYPLVFLATLAAIIASQAVISGAFSLTYQAIRLGFMPRFFMKHYGEDNEGQVYIPIISLILFVSNCLLILMFRSSNSLAGAYGLAVSATMLITTILAFVVFSRRWGKLKSGLLSIFFLMFNVTFFSSNLDKIVDGGWFPIGVAILMLFIMTTWARGRVLEENSLKENQSEDKPSSLFGRSLIKTSGVGVFLASRSKGIPNTLKSYCKHTQTIPKQVIILTVVTKPYPRISANRRVLIQEIEPHVIRVNVYYGFMQSPNVPKVLMKIKSELSFELKNVTFFVGRQTGNVTRKKNMSLWRKKLYIYLSKNAEEQIIHYKIPSYKVFEIGVRYTL